MRKGWLKNQPLLGPLLAHRGDTILILTGLKNSYGIVPY